MNIVFQKKKSVLIVKISGDIDHHCAGRIRYSVDMELLSGGIKKLVLDFSELDFMDSSGIGVIMGRYKLIKGLGGSVYVVGAAPHINKVIQLAGLNKLIGLCDKIDTALKAV